MCSRWGFRAKGPAAGFGKPVAPHIAHEEPPCFCVDGLVVGIVHGRDCCHRFGELPPPPEASRVPRRPGVVELDGMASASKDGMEETNGQGPVLSEPHEGKPMLEAVDGQRHIRSYLIVATRAGLASPVGAVGAASGDEPAESGAAR